MNFELLQASLLSPAVLAFFLGFCAILFKSDLKLPDGLYQTVSVYLLLSLGIKGGAALSACPISTLFVPIGLTIFLGLTLPLIAFFICRMCSYSKVDSAALAAHYGSVSVVTFMTCQLFLDQLNIEYDKHAVSLVAIMEVPGLIVGLMLANKNIQVSWIYEIKSIMLSKSIFLLLGGIFIGYISGDAGLKKVSPFFVDPFQGILVLFMLEMGVLAATKIVELTNIPKSIVILGIGLPILNGFFTILLSYMCHLSVGNATLLAAIASSASYIAAPTAVRIALPDANPAYYLTAAIVVTFPFNLCLGIPLYYAFATYFLTN